MKGENLTDADKGVKWEVTGKTSKGTAISEEGELTVGRDESAKTLTVTATSEKDGRQSGEAAVTVEESGGQGEEPMVSQKSITKLRNSVNAGKKYKKADYTEKTWKAFDKALKNAQNVLKGQNLTQKEVDAAQKALDAATKGLKKPTINVKERLLSA